MTTKNNDNNQAPLNINPHDTIRQLNSTKCNNVKGKITQDLIIIQMHQVVITRSRLTPVCVC